MPVQLHNNPYISRYLAFSNGGEELTSQRKLWPTPEGRDSAQIPARPFPPGRVRVGIDGIRSCPPGAGYKDTVTTTYPDLASGRAQRTNPRRS
jgi:hypothetical protein